MCRRLYMLIIAITSHYIDENFILQEDLLDFGEVDWSHSGINLADHLHKVLTRYGICEKLFCIRTDNASNNDTMCEELSDLLYESHEMDWDGEENHIACLAHVINLAVQAFLKNIKVTQMTELDRLALPGSAPALLPAPAPIPLTSKHMRPCRNAKYKSKKTIESTNPSSHDFV